MMTHKNTVWLVLAITDAGSCRFKTFDGQKEAEEWAGQMLTDDEADRIRVFLASEVGAILHDFTIKRFEVTIRPDKRP